MEELKLLSQKQVKIFIDQKVQEIAARVGDGLAINALSGGVDSAVVTLLGFKALGNRLKTYFIDNGLMRQDEPQQVVVLFASLGVPIIIVEAQEEFFSQLRGVVDPEYKRGVITQVFYQKVFGRLVRESGAKFLLQGTNLTDVEETVAGIKRQHNVLAQLGIDTKKQFGYHLIEPLEQLRKSTIRKVGQALGLPKEVFNRQPFPGPALAARIIGEVTPERVEIVRQATAIVEEVLAASSAFQYLAILHQDRVTGVVAGKREFGYQIEVRCWDSTDAKVASPTRLSWTTLKELSARITKEVPGVVSVVINITDKPPSTIEAI